jgi:asparagine synthase (glutamine-hydrolysing)
VSGIFGVFHLDDRPADPETLGKMADSLAHRGPNGVNIWCDGSIGLGHRMLWTTPESLQENQPAACQSNGLVLTADARIDNRTELIDLLNLGDRPAAKITDSDLILAAYQKWDTACADKLIGDFALVIWDKRKQRLFCARDPMAVKPFYYYLADNIFVFASETKALLCLSQVPRRLNETKLAEFLVRDFQNPIDTFYQNILRLPAAHQLTVSPGGSQIERYWFPDLSRRLKLSSDSEYVDAFREEFTRAVNSRLRSAFPVGSTLSGGLDSSSIACVARNTFAENGQKKLHTFSAIFPNLPADDLRFIDERPFINAITAMAGLEAHAESCDQISPLIDLERVFRHEDEVVFAPNLYLHWSLYKLAKKQGLRVFLDGIDGDAAVSHGIEYLSELARRGRWLTLAKEGSAYARMYGGSRWSIIWDYGFKPIVPTPLRGIWPGVFAEPSSWDTNRAIVNKAFAQRIGLDEHFSKLEAANTHRPRTASEMQWQDLGSSMYAYAMELADKAANAFSLEVRYPFFDRRFIEFSLSVPPGQKLHKGWTRLNLRRAMDGILPTEVQWRPYKANLGASFKRGLLQFEKEQLDAVILDDPSVIEPYIDIPALHQAYDRYQSAPIQYEQEAMSVYIAVVLANWLRNAGLSA